MSATTSCATLHEWQTAGHTEIYFVAAVDHLRRVTMRLSGDFTTLQAAERRLAWLRRRNPSAVIVGDLTNRIIFATRGHHAESNRT